MITMDGLTFVVFSKGPSMSMEAIWIESLAGKSLKDLALPVIRSVACTLAVIVHAEYMSSVM